MPKSIRSAVKRRYLSDLSDTDTGSSQESPLLPPISAARSVYNILETRSHILRLLDKSDLAKCMRFERKGMREVATILYEKVSYNTAIAMKGPRKVTYCAGVREIDAEDMRLSPAMRRTLIPKARVSTGIPGRVSERAFQRYLKEYHDDVVEVVVPSLLSSFPNLRKITFGTDIDAETGPNDFWIAHILPVSDVPPMTSKAVHPNPLFRLGHIERFGRIGSISAFKKAMPGSRKHLRPHRHSVKMRFNLNLTSSCDPSYEWLRLIRKDPDFEDIHNDVTFGQLPITMTDIANLYDKQIAKGHVERLQRVHAINILPWGIYDFERLATVASKSLTKLDLHHDPLSTQPCISFDDLPSLVTIVRECLPRLFILSIDMDACDSAESSCRDALLPTCLEEGGTLRELQIISRIPTPVVFNAIRCVSAMCTSEATLNISEWCEPLYHRSGSRVGAEWTQTDMFHHLRTLPLAQRSHLAVVDFASLDIVAYSDIRKLQYDDDGRPRRIGKVNAEKWSDSARGTKLEAANATLRSSTVSDGLENFAKLSDQLGAISATATAAQMLEEAKGVLKAARTLCVKSSRAAREMGLIVKRNQDAEREVSWYVASLESIVKGQK